MNQKFEIRMGGFRVREGRINTLVGFDPKEACRSGLVGLLGLLVCDPLHDARSRGPADHKIPTEY